MIIKKLIKPINNVGVASIQFNGIAPISVNNDTHEISIDLSNYYNKSEIDDKLSNVDVDLSGYARLNDESQSNSGSGVVNTIWANDFRTRKTRFSSYDNSGYVSGANQLILKDETSGNQLVVGSTLTFKNQEIATKPYVDSLISPITNDISLIKQEQTTQNQQIQSNRDLSNQIIEGLQNQLRVFTPRGAYNSSTNYMKNDFVSYNQFTFVSLVDNNRGNTPSILQDSQYWMRAGITINSTPDGVATEIWVNNQLQGYLQLDTYNSNMEELRTNLTQQLATKQDTLTAGNNITIENNTISSNIDLSNYAKLNERNDFSGYNSFIQLAIVGNQNDLGKLSFTPPIPYYEAYMEYNSPNTRAKNDVCVDLYVSNRNNDRYNYQQSDLSIMRYKDVKDYVANNIPQPQEINLVENVEVAIPNYKVNNKQVYQIYLTTNQQLKDIIAIADYISIKGLVRNTGGYYKQCPWYWGSGQVYLIDAQSSGGLASAGFGETGHKIVCKYTKK